MTNSPWPRGDNASLIAFYGDPRKPGWEAANLVYLKPPFKITYEGKPMSKGIRIHRKCVDAVRAALQEIWEACGQDQATIDKTGITRFSGSYNQRPVRGSTTRMSTHTFGAALDFDAANNAMRTPGKIPKFVVDAFKRQEIFWGGWFKNRKDPMHFQCASEGAGYPVADLDTPAEFEVAAYEPEVDNNSVNLDSYDTEAYRPTAIYQPQNDLPVKPLYKSWIGRVSAMVGLGGAGVAGSAADDPRLLTLLGKLIEKPTFWMGLLIIAGAGYIMYLRWKDAQRGRVNV